MRSLGRSLPMGFTLVEVLVALSIMAMMAVMCWQGVDGIVRGRAISQTRLEHLLRVNTVLAQWEQDFIAIQDVKSVPPLAFDGASLTLTRRTTDGMQLVVWSLRDGAWYRWAGPGVTSAAALRDTWMLSKQFLGNEQGQLRLLSDVSKWQVYYFRENAWSNPQSSAGNSSLGLAADAPPDASTSSNPVPDGVRLVLTLAQGKGLSGQITRDIAVGPQ